METTFRFLLRNVVKKNVAMSSLVGKHGHSLFPRVGCRWYATGRKEGIIGQSMRLAEDKVIAERKWDVKRQQPNNDKTRRY